MKISRKICVLGDFGVGKTSLVRRYVHGLFDDQYRATLGVNCYAKDFELLHPDTASMVNARAVVWDIEGGQERLRQTDSYLIGCQGALLVADISRPQTLSILHAYALKIRTIAPACPIRIAVNKCDLAQEIDAASEMIAQAGDLALSLSVSAPVIETSAATGDQVPEVFSDILSAGLSRS